MKIRHYTIGDHQWTGVEVNGVLYLIMYLGRKGDCVRP